MSSRSKRIVLMALQMEARRNTGVLPSGGTENSKGYENNNQPVQEDIQYNCPNGIKAPEITQTANSHETSGFEDSGGEFKSGLESENENIDKQASEVAQNHSIGDYYENSDFEDSGSEVNSEDCQSEDTTSASGRSDDGIVDEYECQNGREPVLEVVEAFTGRPKKGRKIKFPGQTFKTRKRLKDSNKQHYSVKGKLVPAKPFHDFQCHCRMKCNERIGTPTREELFKKCWDLQSYNAQTSYIAATVAEKGVKRKRNKASERRNMTRTYHLTREVVCKNMYLKTFQISSKRVNTALQKLRTGNFTDNRGTNMSGCIKKLSEAIKSKIIDHISQFPTYISHYSRKETESRFLAPDLTIDKMYSLFLESNPKEASFSTYKKIFYAHFNLRRKPPIKDTCNVCDRFASNIKNNVVGDSKEEEANLHKKHLDQAESARQAMKNDLQRAVEEPEFEAITYDMEKVLGLPKIPTNIVYYKRQLSVYNEGVYVGSNKKSYCFLWKEGLAGRGAQEVGSCLKKCIDDYLNPNTEELTLWSDSCGGQNRNIKIVLLLKAVLQSHKSLKHIYFKYLIPGHSFLPNDTDFGEIERALKKQLRVYTMDDFKKIVESSSKKRPLATVEMKREDFVGIEELQKIITNRKNDVNGQKINWLQAREIKISKDFPFSIFFKYSHAEEQYKEVDIKKTLRGRPTECNFASKLKLLYPEGKVISNKKLADIASLLPLVPADARFFYENLTSAEFEDDVDGFGNEIDFEVDD